MTRIVTLHPRDPQPRRIAQVVDLIRDGALIVYPTDSCYALGCQMGNKPAMERIRQIRRSGREHHFTLVCRDLSEIASYARVENQAYRLLRTLTPGPYTFILRATREVPKRLQNPRRKTIGIRVPDHVIAQSVLTELGEPLMSSTLLLPEQQNPLNDPVDIMEQLHGRVDVVVDGGNCGLDPTTVIDLVEDSPKLVRLGRGPVDGIR